jgi:hypothetical protein
MKCLSNNVRTLKNYSVLKAIAAKMAKFKAPNNYVA